MNKIGIYIILLSVFLVSFAGTVKNECDVRILKNELLLELRPDYKYDSSKLNRFKLDDQKQGTEVKVPLFAGENYRMLFNTAGLTSEFEIQIYDKPHDSKKRKLLFSVKRSETDGKHIFTYEPKGQNSVYIDYLLPGEKEKDLTGCIVFLLGYRIN